MIKLKCLFFDAASLHRVQTPAAVRALIISGRINTETRLNRKNNFSLLIIFVIATNDNILLSSISQLIQIFLRLHFRFRYY